MLLLRGWAQVLSTPTCNSPMPRRRSPSVEILEQRTLVVKELRVKLNEYQSLLDLKRIKDYRVWRASFEGRMPSSVLTGGIVQASLLAGFFHLLAAPGILLWLPVWALLKSRERAIFGKGLGWVDSIAEAKMLLSFSVLFVVLTLSNVFAPILVLWIVLTLRSYETAVAYSRSLYSLFKLMFLYDRTFDTMLLCRRDVNELVLEASAMLPDSAKELPQTPVWATGAPPAAGASSAAPALHPPQWTVFDFFFRRQKKDWNEVLRMEDINTLSYQD